MRFVARLSLTLLLGQGSAHAGLWDRVRGSASACTEGLTKVSSTLGEASREMSRLQSLIEQQVRDLATGMTALSTQLSALGLQGKDCGTASVTALVTEALPMVVRVVRFGGELGDVKDGIVLPLIARLQDIREARDQGLSVDTLATRLTRLALFTVEVGLKIPKFAPNAAEATVSGALGGVVTGLALQNPLLGMAVAQMFDQAQAGGGTAGKDLSQKLIAAVVSNLKGAMIEPNLTLAQRLDRMISMEEILIEWFTSVGEVVGWGDLETELAAWRKAHSSP